ncbi:MAG: glycosyltransferase family 4 protein [Deltaproteobacteria bacterium]
MLRVTALTGGRNVPSARFRVRQYIAPLRALGVEVREMCPLLGRYPPATKLIRPLWAALSLAERLPALAASYCGHVTLLQRELLSTLATLEGLSARPRVFDMDDAIFLRGNGHVRRIVASCDLVICGNQYLAEHVSAWNRRVEILPTAVDTERYRPLTSPPSERASIIGWIGSSVNLPSLLQIEAPLARVLQRFPKAKLRVVSDACPIFRSLAREQLEFLPWSTSIEVAAIGGMTVGLMPLEDSAWSRGKCSFKMLQYLSAGVPAVVSPVGMNREVAALGSFAALASSNDEWYGQVAAWLADPEAAAELGRSARAAIESHFSVTAIAPRLARLLSSLVH